FRADALPPRTPGDLRTVGAPRGTDDEWAQSELAAGGSHNSMRFPSGSITQPNFPYDSSWTLSSTAAPAARSCARIALRSLTRKLIIKGALLGSKYVVAAGNGAQTRNGPGSPSVGNIVSPCSSVGRPRWSRYQALSFTGSFALKKMPPTPR